MKINVIIVLFLSIWGAVGSAIGSDKVKCTVTNPLNSMRKDEPVVIQIKDIQKVYSDYVGGYVSVYDGETEICSQLDDLNNDGIWDELVFLTDLGPKQEKIFTVRINIPADSKPLECVKEVHAQMFFYDKSQKKITPTLEASSPSGNLYNQLYHHGPAWETDKIGYRLYFDKKSTVDVYGKKKYRLELDSTKWYPSAKQLSESYGDDILWVGNSVGVGTLKGWNGKEALHIEPILNRTARIVIAGQLRTIVDMSVEGWQYDGQSLNVTARYIQYARHRDATARIIIEGSVLPGNIDFCTGVQKVRKSRTYSEKDGLLAVWGSEYPSPDSVRFAKETFGLGVIVPRKNIKQQATDDLNHLFVITNKKKPVMEYTITAAAEKEEEGYKSADEFFAYMKELKELVRNPIKVKLGKM